MTIHHRNYDKVYLHFGDGKLSGDSSSYWVWTFNILISNTSGSRLKYDIATIALRLDTTSKKVAVTAVNRNRVFIIDTLVKLVANNKTEMEKPSHIAAKLGGDSEAKEYEFTLRITDTPNLRDKLKERGLIK
jgi:hypothetical protein